MVQIIIRQISILALVNGLLDTGRLLGIGLGDADPLQMFSVTGFVLLGGFAIARVFAAVGMWIESNWGTPLLFGVTLFELGIYLFSVFQLDIGFVGFIARLIELAGTIVILWFIFRARYRGIHD